jgi:hypothetical protein
MNGRINFAKGFNNSFLKGLIATSMHESLFYFMAKDPAFLFYYDRFLAGTISMTDSEVGQYIRLMCIQANKGFISKKDMLNICKTSDNEVCLKFASISEDKYVNTVLAEIIEQRKTFTESRRNNRKGKKQELVKNTSKTYVPHMVNVNVNKDVNIEVVLKDALDELYMEQQKMKWPHLDFDFEHRTFCEKVRGSPSEYGNRDTNSIRLAFQYQLRNSKGKKNGHSKNKQSTADLAEAFAIRVMQNNSGQQFPSDK